MSSVYPLSYSKHGWCIEQLMAQNSNALLIDTRKSPRSKMKGWNKEEVQERFGERYRFAGDFLGNVNFSNGLPIKLANPSTGIAGLIKYLKEGHDLITTCGCHEYTSCHLHVIMDLLRQAMPQCCIEDSFVSALSIRQPYASWLANPGKFIEAQITPKIIENRDWTTNYRGRLLIHASKTFEDDAISFWQSKCSSLGDAVSLNAEDYPLGAIVGEAMLTSVVTQGDLGASDPWFCGPYGFVLSNANPIDPPVPCRGALKVFQIPEWLLQNTGKEVKNVV